MRRLDAGFANIGDVQFLPGYCVLLVDTPDVQRLTDLPRHRRLEFLADMDLLAEAVERVCAHRDPGFRRNFDHMPELHWKYGYPIIMVVIIAICAVLYRSFKRRNWL